MTPSIDPIESFAKRFVSVLADAATPPEDVYRSSASFLRATHGLSVAELDGAASIVVRGCDLDDLHRAAFAATCCAALVERGASVDIAGPEIVKRLSYILRAADQFLTRLGDYYVPPPSEIECHVDDERYGLLWNETVISDALIDVASADMPAEADAFFALNLWGPAACTCLSLSAKLRRQLRGAKVLKVTKRLAGAVPAARTLYMLIKMLDDEVIVFLDVHSRSGYECRISNVVHAEQLGRLLRDVFDGLGDFLSNRLPRYTPLYPWYALNGGVDTFSIDADYFDYAARQVVPADFRKYDGVRLALIGRPAFWCHEHTCPELRCLSPSLSVARILDKTEVEDWFHRLLAGKSKQPSTVNLLDAGA